MIMFFFPSMPEIPSREWIHIPPWEKENHRLKMPFFGDMLVPWRVYRFTLLNPHLPCSFMLHLFAQEKTIYKMAPYWFRHGVVTPLDGNSSYTVTPISGAKTPLNPAARGSIEKLLPFKQKNNQIISKLYGQGMPKLCFPNKFQKMVFLSLSPPKSSIG